MNRKQRRAAIKGGTVRAHPSPTAAAPPSDTTADIFVIGLNHHRAGRLAQAESCYRRVLAVNSNHVDALHLLGVVAHQVGKNALAIDLISKAVELNDGICIFHSNLGNALKDQGRFIEAEVSYRRALALDPKLAQSHNNLGHALQSLGKLAEAELSFRRALALEPEFAQAHYNLGVALQTLGKPVAAEASYRQALALTPDYAEAYYNSGIALHALGKLAEAEVRYRRALLLQPELAEAHSGLGNARLALNKVTEAEASYLRVLALMPDSAEAYFDAGIALHALGKLAEAESSYRRALALRTNYAEAYNNLGSALKEQKRLVEGCISYLRALALMPEFGEAYFNLGIELQELNKPTEAAVCYRRALALKPNHVDAHYNLGLALLLGGRLDEGWPEYEWRWNTKDYSNRRRDFGRPVWNGEAMDGLLLLHAEQGLGDTIQFCRYASLAAARCRIMLQVPRPLVRLLSNLAGVDQVIAAGDPVPAFAASCPLLSLPHVFNTTLETIPAPVPYLTTEPERIAVWRGRLPRSGFRIGIVWAGSPHYKSDRARSAPLISWAPLARLPGVRLISLQKGPGLDQLGQLPQGMEVHTLGQDFDAGADAFLDTAAVMMNLDLIIAVDTAVAHLAGALGRPVWLATTTPPHWVWMLRREDSPWYPTIRLFRQTSPGDWASVFERMAHELASLLDASTGRM
jgi:tetratricopeptide (TPR) repeat protein